MKEQAKCSRRDFIKGATIASGSLAMLGGALLTGCNPGSEADAKTAGLVDGTYSGTAAGRSGDIVVEANVVGGNLFKVRVVEQSETATLADAAIDIVTNDIVELQSLGVDTVSGATLTSFAVKNAATQALSQAGDVKALEAPAHYPDPLSEDASCDIVVVGAGSAGMMAAAHAADAGKQVILIEKQGFLGGGDTMFASSGMGGGGGYTTYRLNIEDHNEEDYLQMTLKEGEKSGLPVDVDNLTAYCMASGEALDYYISVGIPFSGYDPDKWYNLMFDGSSPGVHMVKRLAEHMEVLGIDTRVNTKLESIVVESGKATGIKVSNKAGGYAIAAKAVILTSGGFGYNEDMLEEYADAGAYRGLPHTGASSAMGEGILAAQEIGADICNMTAYKVNNLGHVADNGSVSSLATIRTVCALVNDDGERFINETETSITERSIAELEQPNQEAWAIFSQKSMDDKALLQSYDKLGYFVSGDTWEALGAEMGFDSAATKNLVEAMEAWQKTEKGEKEPVFGTKVLDPLTQAPFYAVKVKPAMQSTYGGVRTDPSARVIDKSGDIIVGLYAAGAVSGHGCFGNEVGEGLTIASTFGMIAGKTAAAETL